MAELMPRSRSGSSGSDGAAGGDVAAEQYAAAVATNSAVTSVTFKLVNGKLYLTEQPTKMLTYGCLWTTKEVDGNLIAVCRIQGCAKETILARAGGAVNASNATAHVKSMHREFVAQADVPPIPAAAAGAKRVRKDEAADAVAPAALVRDALVQFVALGMMPFSLVDNLGFKSFAQMLGITLPSRSTVRRDFQRSLKALVHDPMVDRLAALATQHTMVLAGVKFAFAPLKTISADGWTTHAGLQMESVEVSGCVVTTMLGGVAARLLPSVFPVALVNFTHGAGGTGAHDAAAHAALMVTTLSRLTPPVPPQLLCAVLDTTAVQHKWVERPEFIGGGVCTSANGGERSGMVFVYCLAHVYSLLTKDLMRVPKFKAIMDVCSGFSTWTLASEKRWRPLLVAQAKVAPTKVAVKPLRGVVTRFFYALLAAKRVGRLCEAVEYMRAPAVLDTLWLDNPETKASFLEHAAAVTALAPELAMLDKLFKPLLELTPSLSHEEHYSAALRVPFLHLQLDAIATTTPTATAGVREIAEAYKRGLYERTAPIGYWAAGVPLAGAEEPVGQERTRRLHWDELSNAAGYLDPATTSPHVFDRQGGSVDDATTHCVLALLAAWQRPQLDDAGGDDGEGAGGAAAMAGAPLLPLAARKAASAKEIAAIRARTKPPFQAAASWKDQQDNDILAVRIKHQLDAGGGDDVDAINLEDAIHEAFDLEAKLYKTMRMGNFFTVDKFGEPVAKIHKNARYTFWPSQAAKLPLHFVCARIFLGVRATANANESFHSTASYIANKMRSAMKPETIEQVSGATTSRGGVAHFLPPRPLSYRSSHSRAS